MKSSHVLVPLAVQLWTGGLAAAEPVFPPSGPTVTIDSGVIIGTASQLPQASSVVNKYLGVPFAAPVERWVPPKKAIPWRQPLKATAFGPACLQAWNAPSIGPDLDVVKALVNNPPLPESEDCLTVNVFAPATTGPPRAVLVMITGGAFLMGGSGSPFYDASPFAAYEDVVAVSFNYRTNVFGFQGSTEIPIERRNLGLLDQRFALDWVQKNIGAFGGDAAKVTVWGTSAGAESVDSHLMMYGRGKTPPFRAAIMETGSLSVGLLASRTNNTPNWQDLVAAANCSSARSPLQCMSAVPARALKEIQESKQLTFTPIIDNVTIPADPPARRKNGDFAKVPVLSGTVAEEGRLLVIKNITLNDFVEVFLNAKLFPDPLRQSVLAAYPKGRNGLLTDFDVAAAIYTDFMWQCPQAIVARQTAEAGVPSWRYYFNASAPSFLPPDLGWLRKCHGVDSFVLFSHPGDARHTPQTYTLARSMRAAWASFIKNPAAGPGWPALGSGPFGGVDVGVLGDALDAPSGGVTATSRDVVDRNCKLYKPVYDAMAGFVL